MCLAIPGLLVGVGDGALRMGRVDFGGVVKDVCLAYVPDAALGDYVIVHAGFAISRVDADEAARVFAYVREIEDADDPPPGGSEES